MADLKPDDVKVGAVVRLKSGGVAMTIAKVSALDATRVKCVWTDKNGVPQEQEYDVVLLAKAQPKSG